VSETTPSAYSAGTIPHCYRHPDRETYIACQRCGRPICPDCMRQAAVGFQCPDCVRSGAASARTPRTSFGGKATASSSAVTLGLIGANIAVFLIAHATGGMTGTFTESMGLLPDSTPYAPSLGLQGVAQGSYWELITSTFLHLQVLHIAMNMIGLWIFGSFLEHELGRWRFLALYLTTGLVGSVAVYLLAGPHVSALGASGSVFGLFAAAFIVLMRQHRDVTQLLVLLALNLFISFAVPNIAWQAHIGGLLAGFAMGAAFAYAPRQQRTLAAVGTIVGLVVVCAVVVALRTSALTA
jgi:membrane associated rhomboid family serine protease